LVDQGDKAKQGTLTIWEGSIQLTSLNSTAFDIANNTYFKKIRYLYEEVNHGEPSLQLVFTEQSIDDTVREPLLKQKALYR
jgi:hypothetical protein